MFPKKTTVTGGFTHFIVYRSLEVAIESSVSSIFKSSFEKIGNIPEAAFVPLLFLINLLTYLVSVKLKVG